MNELEMAEDKLTPEMQTNPGRKPPRLKLPKTNKNKVILGIVVMGILSLIISFAAFRIGVSALKKSYKTTFEKEKEAAYNAQYEKYFKQAEKAYHVSNRVNISIEGLKETANLEVLEVSDTEYIISDKEDNGNGITSWLEVPGQGTYIVNLQAAEFIVDNEREYVLVRAPYPEITNISIDYGNVKKLLFKNNIFNDSYSVGEDLARSQLNSADLLIKKEFASNQHFYLSAQEAAVSSIQCLVKQLNPKLPDMTVDVEFY